MSDNYTAAIHAMLKRQTEKGISKYGATLEDGTVGILEAINHAQEEACDLLYYLEHIKAKLKEKGIV